MMSRERILQGIRTAFELLLREYSFEAQQMPLFSVAYPEHTDHGDYATNIAMVSTKLFKKSPRDIAGQFAEFLRKELITKKQPLCERIEVADPGFINFYLAPTFLQAQAGVILKEGKRFGSGKLGKRVNVEYVSANPTGPLTLASGRGGYFGDVLSRTLAFAGAKVTREYYVNDAGNQIKTLGESVLAWAGLVPKQEHQYQGGYIAGYAKEFSGKLAAYVQSPEKLGKKVADAILSRDIKPPLARAGILFDRWVSEAGDIRSKGLVEKTLTELQKRGLVYEKDDALWLKTSQFGDDKDRVLRKSVGDKDYTYVAVDIPHHLETWKKNDALVVVLGTDHHGDVARLQAGMQMLGKPPITFVLMQMIRLLENGSEVRMSKRTGNFVTFAELLDEVGADVARFFFLMYQPNTHMDFDLTLAKERSEKNPVYYVQYAYARLCGVMRKAAETKGIGADGHDLAYLVKKEELALMKLLARFPELIEDIARTYEAHRLAHYATELARMFHVFYDTTRVVDTEKLHLSSARIALVKAVKTVLASVMGLMGISAPERMAEKVG